MDARPEPNPRPAPRPLAANFAANFSIRVGAGAASDMEERRVAARRKTYKPMCFILEDKLLECCSSYTGFSERPLLILYLPLLTDIPLCAYTCVGDLCTVVDPGTVGWVGEPCSGVDQFVPQEILPS